MLIVAIISISLALVCYSIGVWSEKLSGRLKGWHLAFFWVGFFFDTLGTTIMGKISGSFKIDIHSITGLAALLLMLFHAVWATAVLQKKNEHSIKSFHRFSLTVWFVWLIPYLTGLVLNIS